MRWKQCRRCETSTREIHVKGKKHIPWAVIPQFPCLTHNSVNGHSIHPAPQTQALELSLTPFSHSASNVSANAVDFTFKIYQESNHFSPPPPLLHWSKPPLPPPTGFQQEPLTGSCSILTLTVRSPLSGQSNPVTTSVRSYHSSAQNSAIPPLSKAHRVKARVLTVTSWALRDPFPQI